MSRGGAIFVILALVVMGQAAIDIYLASMPAMMAEFNVSEDIIQLTISTFLLGFGFSQLVYGPVSDFYGRRAVLFFGLPLFVASTIACVFTHSSGWLLFFRFCEGVGIAAASVSARSIMRDYFRAKELPQISSYMAMAWALVPILAPLIGGYIQHYMGWRTNFVFLATAASLLSLYLYLYLPETNQHARVGRFSFKSPFFAYKTLLGNKVFTSNMVVLAMLFSIFSIFNTSSSFLYEVHWGASPVVYGWTLLFISAGYFGGSFLNSRLIIRIDPRTVVGWGVAGLVLTSAVSFLIQRWASMGPDGLGIEMFLIYMALGLIFANSVAACLRPFPGIAGSASAMYGFLVFTGGFVSSAVFAKVFNPTLGTLTMTLLVLSILMALAFTGTIFVYRTVKQTAKSNKSKGSDSIDFSREYATSKGSDSIDCL